MTILFLLGSVLMPATLTGVSSRVDKMSARISIASGLLCRSISRSSTVIYFSFCGNVFVGSVYLASIWVVESLGFSGFRSSTIGA